MDGSFREVAESELVRTIYAGNAPAGQGAQPGNPPASQPQQGAQP